jgi:hypothetical protein
VVQTFCLKQTFGLFMPKWTLACVWHAEMNFGKPKRITEIRIGCVGHLHPPRRKSFGKTKMNTKKIPAWMKEMGWKAFSEPKLRRAKEQGCS